MESCTIEQTAICHVLAEMLYDAHARFYAIPVPSFEALSFHAKEIWIDRALEAIEAVGPSRARVLGVITPDAPWGITA